MKIIRQKLAIFINFILLSVVYLIGVGLTSIFARIVSKDFLSIKSKGIKKTSYINFKKASNLERMY